MITQTKRNQIARALQAAGFGVLKSEGTYFITASIRKIANEPDTVFCKRMTREARVAAIPLSVFYSEAPPSDLVRFAFCKTPAIIDEAGRRLAQQFVSGNR